MVSKMQGKIRVVYQQTFWYCLVLNRLFLKLLQSRVDEIIVYPQSFPSNHDVVGSSMCLGRFDERVSVLAVSALCSR